MKYNIIKYKLLKFLLLFILLSIELYFVLKYYYCFKCINNSMQTSKCIQCSTHVVFNGLKINSEEETLNQIITNKKSISRYGDGEFNLIFGENLIFQKYNKILSNRLKEILINNDTNFLVGINIPYKDLNKFNNHEKNFWINYFKKNKFKLVKLLNKKKEYFSSAITRFFYRYKDKSKVPFFIKLIKKIWENQDILIIEGDKSRIGIGNDLFNNTRSIKRIICPVRNAFKVYDKIIKQVLNVGEKRLILIALGPTATVLSYDLYKLGYQCLDFGHLDIEYEWFLRNATKKIQIENKYVNFANEKDYKFTEVKDKNYYNQIIAKILN